MQLFPLTLFTVISLEIFSSLSILITSPILLVHYLLPDVSADLVFNDCELFLLCNLTVTGWLMLIMIYFVAGALLANLYKFCVFTYQKVRNKLSSKHYL